MLWFRANSVSVTSLGTLVAVNSAEAIDNIRRGDALVISGYDPVEIKEARVSGNQVLIELMYNWPHGAVNNKTAQVMPTFGDFNALARNYFEYRQIVNNNFSALYKWGTEMGTVIFKDNAGGEHEARTLKQMDADVTNGIGVGGPGGDLIGEEIDEAIQDLLESIAWQTVQMQDKTTTDVYTKVEVKENNEAIATETQARVQQATQLSAEIGSLDTRHTATVSRVNRAEADINGNTQAISLVSGRTTNAQTRADAAYSLAQKAETDAAGNATSISITNGNVSTAQGRANAAYSLAQKAEGDAAGNASSLTTIRNELDYPESNTTALGELAILTKRDVEGNTSSISTIRNQLDLPESNSTALGQLAILTRQDTNGLLAQAFLSVDVNGRVAGIKATATDSVSNIDIIGDKIRFLKPSNLSVGFEWNASEGDFVFNGTLKAGAISNNNFSVTKDGKVTATDLLVRRSNGAVMIDTVTGIYWDQVIGDDVPQDNATNNSVLTGSGAPASDVGTIGDVYIDTSNSSVPVIWVKKFTGWVKGGAEYTYIENLVSQKIITTDLDADNIKSGTISSATINIGGGNFTVNSSGFMVANAGHFRGDISGATGTFAGKLSGGEIDIGSRDSTGDRFQVNTAGHMTCRGALFSGAVNMSLEWKHAVLSIDNISTIGMGLRLNVGGTGLAATAGALGAQFVGGWSKSSGIGVQTYGGGNGIYSSGRYGHGIISKTEDSGSSAFYAEAGGYSPFTGSHQGIMDIADCEVGDILCDESVIHKADISNAICVMVSSSKPMDRAARGVYVGSQDIDKDDNIAALPTEDLKKDLEGKKLVSFNALGEGLLNVCGENGDIEIGDLLTTSSLLGKGMKQNDDVVRNYTVAESREKVTFDSPDQVKQIAVIYKCG